MSLKLKSLIIGDLEIKIPIIQGGMGVMVSTACLAGAVAACGGAGTIASVALGYGTPENEVNYLRASREGLKREIRRAKEITDGAVGINILVALNNFKDLSETSAQEKADFIVAGAGLPLSLPEYTRGSATKLIPIVSSARATDIIIKAWKRRYDRLPDGFVVEGPLAGGHLGFKSSELEPHKMRSLENLVVEVLSAIKNNEDCKGKHVPVIAAGGIYDGKDIARFLKLGADGVQIASRFVATKECSVADSFKQAYIAAQKDDIVIIDSPVGMPGRVVQTEFINRMKQGKRMRIRCNYRCLKTCNPATTPYCIIQALFNAVSGHLDDAVVFAGSNVWRIEKVVPVKELMDELVRETIEELEETGQG